MSQLKTKLTTIVLMMVLLLAHADSGQLYTSDKLASSLINCVVQDNYGYIWIGTEYGLSRFDGYRFTNYQHDSKDTTSIIDNTISQIKIDKSGHLWIGCAKGLMRYNYATNSFHRYNFPNGIQPRVYDIIQSHNGNILIGTAGYGILENMIASNLENIEFVFMDTDWQFLENSTRETPIRRETREFSLRKLSKIS